MDRDMGMPYSPDCRGLSPAFIARIQAPGWHPSERLHHGCYGEWALAPTSYTSRPCPRCGKPIIVPTGKRNRQKYCKPCQTAVKAEKYTAWYEQHADEQRQIRRDAANKSIARRTHGRDAVCAT